MLEPRALRARFHNVGLTKALDYIQLTVTIVALAVLFRRLFKIGIEGQLSSQRPIMSHGFSVYVQAVFVRVCYDLDRLFAVCGTRVR